MNLLKLLLYPLATLYNGIMRVRNHLYDIGHKPTFHFETSIISVGNLNVGGSGKTPMVEYLIHLLKDKYPTVTLSRGYKRMTSGYRVATSEDTAATIGDEPLQLLKKFEREVKVVVGEDRVFAIPNILQEFPDTRVILMDDGFQQRQIKAHLSILLTEWSRPFSDDFVLPFGRLREARQGASRADIIVVTKCDESLRDEVRLEMTKRLQRYAGQKSVFFSCIHYGEPEALLSGNTFSGPVVIVTGIANAAPLRKYCENRFGVLHHFEFSDHHRYSQGDLRAIDQFCKSQHGGLSVITTEKDAVKLRVPEFETYLMESPWFVLPIENQFLQDGPKFDALVLETVNQPVTS
ncbi:MAG: tetraacyldisaccharide 4'-kinase [Cytophagales bacterium]|nr:tetraacyldisaccharide 4'-kinase [Cytophagales bacterium]